MILKHKLYKLLMIQVMDLWYNNFLKPETRRCKMPKCCAKPAEKQCWEEETTTRFCFTHHSLHSSLFPIWTQTIDAHKHTEERYHIYKAIFFLIDPEICLKIFGLLCCSAAATALPLLTPTSAFCDFPCCRASNLSGAIEKSISACSSARASAVMGRTLCRPSVLDPSLMEWVKYSGREEGGGVETTRLPWPVV